MNLHNKYHLSKEELEGMVSIMRPSIFGNPFIIGKDGDRDEVVEKFKTYFLDKVANDPTYRQALFELYESGDDIYCCCSPQRCHGDYIVNFYKMYKKLTE